MDEKLLESLGIRNIDTVIVAIGGQIQSSILVTVILKELGAKKIIAKAQNDLHAKVLYKVGADRVIFPEKDMGIKVARNLISENILELIELSDEYSIVEIKPPANWVGKSLKELSVRSRYGINVMAVKKDRYLKVAPNANYEVCKNDLLILLLFITATISFYCCFFSLLQLFQVQLPPGSGRILSLLKKAKKHL